MFSNPPSRKSCHLWNEVDRYGTSRQATDKNIIRRMRVAYWTHKTTNTHSKYVIFTAFPLQQWLHECPSMCTYIAWLVYTWCKVLCLLIFSDLLPLSCFLYTHICVPFSPSFSYCHRPCSYPFKIIGKISHYRSSSGSHPTVFKFQLRYCKDYMPAGASCVCCILDEKCRILSPPPPHLLVSVYDLRTQLRLLCHLNS